MKYFIFAGIQFLPLISLPKFVSKFVQITAHIYTHTYV